MSRSKVIVQDDQGYQEGRGCQDSVISRLQKYTYLCRGMKKKAQGEGVTISSNE